MKWQISNNIKHDLTPAFFAYEFAKSEAKKKGLGWKVQVVVTGGNSGFRGYRGRAWNRSNGKGRILVRLSEQLPSHIHEYARYKNMPTFYIGGGEESIVYIFAHEFAHIIGWDGSKSGERGACMFGYRAVEAWRDRQYDSPAILI